MITIITSKFETSKFGWMLNNIRIEKIMSAPMWATIFFYYFLF